MESNWNEMGVSVTRWLFDNLFIYFFLRIFIYIFFVTGDNDIQSYLLIFKLLSLLKHMNGWTVWDIPFSNFFFFCFRLLSRKDGSFTLYVTEHTLQEFQCRFSFTSLHIFLFRMNDRWNWVLFMREKKDISLSPSRQSERASKQKKIEKKKIGVGESMRNHFIQFCRLICKLQTWCC